MAEPTLRELEEQLRTASADVAAVTPFLNTQVTTCGCCDRQSWKDRDEYQLAREIEAASAKVRKVADKLQGLRLKRDRLGTTHPTTGEDDAR